MHRSEVFEFRMDVPITACSRVSSDCAADVANSSSAQPARRVLLQSATDPALQRVRDDNLGSILACTTTLREEDGGGAEYHDILQGARSRLDQR